MESLTQIETAKRLDLSPKQVRRLTKQHGMPRNEDGSYPWPRAQKWYIQFKQHEVISRKNLSDDETLNPDKELALKRRVEREIKELELAERRGQLVPHYVHLEVMHEAGAALRSQLLSWPGRRADEKAATEDPEEIRQIEEKEARELLETLQQLFGPSENGHAPDD